MPSKSKYEIQEKNIQQERQQQNKTVVCLCVVNLIIVFFISFSLLLLLPVVFFIEKFEIVHLTHFIWCICGMKREKGKEKPSFWTSNFAFRKYKMNCSNWLISFREIKKKESSQINRKKKQFTNKRNIQITRLTNCVLKTKN